MALTIASGSLGGAGDAARAGYNSRPEDDAAVAANSSARRVIMAVLPSVIPVLIARSAGRPDPDRSDPGRARELVAWRYLSWPAKKAPTSRKSRNARTARARAC